MQADPSERRGEYRTRGDYHRALDPHWNFYPTYLAKLEITRRHLNRLPAGTRVLDVGCGEGVLVEEYRSRLSIVGVDHEYGSPHVMMGSVLDLPFRDGTFPHALCLDVLEHLPFAQQTRALDELYRVLEKGGDVLVSVPNLAHLQSRLHFLIAGRLMRTASERKHPGDRPIGEFLRMFDAAGFRVVERHGIFPTVPILTALIHKRPVAFMWLHRFLTVALPVPGWCFLNVLLLKKRLQPRQAPSEVPGPAKASR